MLSSDDEFEDSNSTTSFNINGSNVVTYRGRIRTLQDALILLEATRLEKLPTINRRLTTIERNKYIKPNTIFVWNETTCGMKRWTDGKLWSASKVYNTHFLMYKQLNKFDKRVDPSGLIKQSFSLITKQNQRLHLIAYFENDGEETPTVLRKKRKLIKLNYSSSSSSEEDNFEVFDDSNSKVAVPSQDAKLKDIVLSTDVYHDNLLFEVPRSRRHRNENGQPQVITPPASTSPAPTQNVTASTLSQPISSTTTALNTSITRVTTQTPLPSSLSTTVVPTASPPREYTYAMKPFTTLPPPPKSISNFRANYSRCDSSTLDVLDKGFSSC